MDGIFGVGVPEIIIVLVVLFVVGGPENTVKWARELGRWIRKARLMWAAVVADIESDLGEDGQELVKAAQELRQGLHDVSTMQPARQLLSESLQAVQDTASEIDTSVHSGQSSDTKNLPPSSNGHDNVP